MSQPKCYWSKIISLCLVGLLSAFLFVVSLKVDYQRLVIEEHVKFRKHFPTQANWLISPYGTLRFYLFNFTNSEEFLNGTDSKLKLKEVGPIVYRILGKNIIYEQTDSQLTYEKIRYYQKTFDPQASSSPDILNQTIVLPNYVLLSSAAKFHDWHVLLRHAFNAFTISESIFINQTIHYFLWEYTSTALSYLSKYIPNIVSNCGILHNALRDREEIINVNIGVKRGVRTFFQANTFNNQTYIKQHAQRQKFLKNKNDIYCPIEVPGAYDNSLFSPNLSKNDTLRIIASESCRIHEIKFNNTASHLGFNGYRFTISDRRRTPNCLDNSLGIKLHDGMFDTTKCLVNDVPTAFSGPHFYGSSYNWSEHFEGLNPNVEDHETFIIFEPIGGSPLEERYRFQSNVPMPDMKGYSRDMERFSHLVVPIFWYEYDLDDLPPIVLFLLTLTIDVIPILQPILIGIYLLLSLYCGFKIYRLFKDKQIKDPVDSIATVKVTK